MRTISRASTRRSAKRVAPSASANSTNAPRACSTPCRTAAPLPRFVCRRVRRISAPGASARCFASASATSDVPSRDPSSTSTSSYVRRGAVSAAATLPAAASARAPSLGAAAGDSSAARGTSAPAAPASGSRAARTPSSHASASSSIAGSRWTSLYIGTTIDSCTSSASRSVGSGACVSCMGLVNVRSASVVCSWPGLASISTRYGCVSRATYEADREHERHEHQPCRREPKRRHRDAHHVRPRRAIGAGYGTWPTRTAGGTHRRPARV